MNLRWQTWVANGVAAFALSVSVVSARGSEAFLPTDDSEVLETLPRVFFSGRDELRKLRSQLAAKPNNVPLASELANRWIQLGKQESDPRFYGYARAAISPWWEAKSPPAQILIVRAKLKERDHDYDAAVADLALLVQSHPHDVQAWIELANIYRVQGKYAESQQACDTLAEFAGQAQSSFCRIPLLAATGQAEQAYELLAAILPPTRSRWPGAVPWILTMQADVALALGRDEQAERHYLEARKNDPSDKYLLRSYADYLLDRGREEEVLALLRDHCNDTGVLLRAAIAAKRLGEDSTAASWLAQLKDRFEEIRLRGGEPHGRFEARCVLELQGDPQQALELALANWHKQKEPRDTRNVLEAAIAANDLVRVQPVLAFLIRHGTEDAVLHKLVERLGDNE